MAALAAAGAGGAGVVAALVVLSPPVDALAERHLAVHMLQHVVLLSVTAPLLAIAASVWRPQAWMSSRWSPRPWMRPLWSPARTVVAVVAVGVVVPLWHLPALYDAAERSLPLHIVEHATFVGTSVWFWVEVLAGYRAGVVGAFVALCAGSTPGTVLGFLMTLATSPWYPHYAAFASAIEDQQVAGVAMWTGGNVATLVAACALFAGWLRRLDREPASTPGALRVASSRR